MPPFFLSQMIQTLHIDDDLLVVSKPAGLLSVPGRGEDKQDCLVHRLQATWPDALTVHRLDQVTSGLMVFARTADAQRALSDAFAARRVAKVYEACVEGRMDASEGSIEQPLICDWPNRPKQVVDPVAGKPALTHWSLLSHEAIGSRVQLMPVTGRTHQLRVHLQWLGHPIVGDVFYGAAPAARVMLHARQLAFDHPRTGTSLVFDESPPF